ncbi:hypothetical protein MSG28_011899 [Choristoneura fumiferana]|uniref:Uncharacterized protein n=1 Tax=Choristoneura fumiferana TaxID=7141 RepID=A0ACC0KMV8_CHOFU|nr:hypothetical protein MSG28_011899 [Choristoneura fumiferana]
MTVYLHGNLASNQLKDIMAQRPAAREDAVFIKPVRFDKENIRYFFKLALTATTVLRTMWNRTRNEGSMLSTRQ